MMRRNDFNGEKVWIGALLLMSSRMVWRLVAWKMDGSFRFVMMRVFDAEVGGEYGGTAERSRERGVREREECLDPVDSLSDMTKCVSVWSSLT